MFLLSPIHLPLTIRSPRVIAVACGALLAAASGATYYLTRSKPDAEEIERERRELLARSGRITDGTIMDTVVAQTRAESPDPSLADSSTPSAPAEPNPNTPEIIVYNYRIAGVTYECAQDVSKLAEYVHDIRTDLPIQVRYAPHNPGNSIVVAESWSGLRLKSSPPQHHAD